MKKLVILLLLAGTSLSVYFISCSKSDLCNCENNNFEYIRILENNNTYNFKIYKDENGSNFLFAQEELKNQKIPSSIIGLKTREEEYKTVGWFYILNGDIYNIADNFEISQDKIEAIFLYELKNNKLYATFFKKINNNFEIHLINRLKTNYISTNDVKEICDLYIDFDKIDIISNIVPNEKSYFSFTPDQLQLYLINDPDNEKDKYCCEPCPHAKGECIYDENPETLERGWTCVVCTTRRMQQKLEENNITEINSEDIISDLHLFKNGYLMKYAGGRRLVSDYYFLSDRFNYSILDLEFAIKTFRIFENYLPKIVNLRTNPLSETILIDSNTKSELQNYFIESKSYFNDNQSISKIDYLIDQINNMYGKSNKEITTFLENYEVNEN